MSVSEYTERDRSFMAQEVLDHGFVPRALNSLRAGSSEMLAPWGS
jgi:hypothetical protein